MKQHTREEENDYDNGYDYDPDRSSFFGNYKRDDTCRNADGNWDSNGYGPQDRIGP